MRIIDVTTKQQKTRFINFIYQVYKEDLNFKDTLIGVVKTFLNKSDTFTSNTYIRPIYVTDHAILAQCMFIYNQELPVLQIGFFDALPNQEEAVDLIIKEAILEAKAYDLKRIVIGLNGHVSYGVGLLCDHFDLPICFDSLYNKDYYLKYFEKDQFIKHPLTTYHFEMNSVKFPSAILSRINRDYSFRYLDMKNFKEEMLLFGSLCNQTLKDTFLYFPRPPIAMYELMKDLKPFLKPEYLIFAMKDGKEIGFIFWHPDFNEIIPGGKKNSMIKIGLVYLFNHQKIKNLIINAVGIIEPYKRSAVAYGLLYEIYKNAKMKYIGAESNFVWDNNLDSKMFNQRHMHSESRHYCVFTLDL